MADLKKKQDDQFYINPLIAVSKVFARSIKHMNLTEWKAFTYALTQIKFTEKNKSQVIINKKILAEYIGINADYNHLSGNLERAIGELPYHSRIKMRNEKNWESGNFLKSVGCIDGNVIFDFAEKYMPLFEQLKRDYITLWAEDIFKATSIRTILLYEDLMLHSDSRVTNNRIYTTSELKQLFNIPKEGKGSYMRKKGGFNRSEFEQKVIYPVCNELSKCSMLQLLIQEDGSYFRKVKANGSVVGYEFTWCISKHPNVADALDSKAVIDNPAVMKVANDILKAKKKPQKAKRQHFSLEREYDFDELEESLLKIQRSRSYSDN